MMETPSSINATENAETLISVGWFSFSYECLVLLILYTSSLYDERSYNLEETDIILGNNNQTINVQTLAELVSTEDNYGARIFVCLLAQLLEEERQECDVVCVLNVMATMLHVYPTALHPETLSADQSWVAVTMKSAASLKGPALVDLDEGTSTGETLIFVLLLHYFAVKSLHDVLPGFVDWQSFFVSLKPSEPLAFIGIRCHDLCRLLHFGSPVIKIAASYSLLELFNRISDQINSNDEELRCTVGYLMFIKEHPGKAAFL
ncbi:hypothetical protein ACSQ67_025979 [Phaseolus vulgaris]